MAKYVSNVSTYIPLGFLSSNMNGYDIPSSDKRSEATLNFIHSALLAQTVASRPTVIEGSIIFSSGISAPRKNLCE